MHSITFISTIHKEIGKCNADELCNIIERINPDVIFLEALDETYSEYDKLLFKSFGVYREKLEVKAIQKYSLITTFEYIPVLDAGLSEAFHNKYNIVLNSNKLQKLLDNYEYFAQGHGFKFLNSTKSTKLQEEMRILEELLLNGSEVCKEANDSIDTYENTMLQKIYSYCKNNQFKTAVFMCGVAHRKSIIEKIERYHTIEELNLNWTYFEY